MWKVLAGVLLAVSVIFATVQWVWLYNTLADALEPLGLGVVEGLGLGDPAVEQATASALLRLADPQAVLRAYSAARLLPPLGVAAIVVVIWIQADPRSEALRGRILFATLIALPTIVGFGVMAGPEARSSVQNLREAGLTNPHLVGAGIADIYGMVSLGAALSIVLAVVFLGLGGRQSAR